MELSRLQAKVKEWVLVTFGHVVLVDKYERGCRFLEEALELAQVCGLQAADAHALVDYTFGRPVGKVKQEVGGAVLTLAALCSAMDVQLDECAAKELLRVWAIKDAIRQKHLSKPRGRNPLPGRPRQSHAADWGMVPVKPTQAMLDAGYWPSPQLAARGVVGLLLDGQGKEVIMNTVMHPTQDAKRALGSPNRGTHTDTFVNNFKTQLANAICRRCNAVGRVAVKEAMKIKSNDELSKIVRGEVEMFSIDKLLKAALRAGVNVQVMVD